MSYFYQRDSLNDDHIEGEELFSKISYETLEPREGSIHLVIAQGEGALAVLDLAKKTESTFWNKCLLAYVPDGVTTDYSPALQALKPRRFYEWVTTNSAETRLLGLLAELKRGVRLYVSGTSGFIGIVFKHAQASGINTYEAIAERRGSKSRRVQCVHCKGFMDDVTTQPVTCAHCGLLLLVRGHYSRRLAAYQGVCINAEDPSVVPPTAEVFK